jgi:hypothetical protein
MITNYTNDHEFLITYLPWFLITRIFTGMLLKSVFIGEIVRSTIQPASKIGVNDPDKKHVAVM